MHFARGCASRRRSSCAQSDALRRDRRPPQPIARLTCFLVAAARRAVARLDDLRAAEAAELLGDQQPRGAARDRGRAVRRAGRARGGPRAPRARRLNLALADRARGPARRARARARRAARGRRPRRGDDQVSRPDRPLVAGSRGRATTPPPFPSVRAPTSCRRARTPRPEMAADAARTRRRRRARLSSAGARPSTRACGSARSSSRVPQVFAPARRRPLARDASTSARVPGATCSSSRALRAAHRGARPTRKLGDLWRRTEKRAAAQLVVQRWRRARTPRRTRACRAAAVACQSGPRTSTSHVLLR